MHASHQLGQSGRFITYIARLNSWGGNGHGQTIAHVAIIVHQNVQPVSVSPHYTSILHSLCSSPTPLKLDTLVLDCVVTAEHMPLLGLLPSLTELDALIDAAAAPHLPRLTQLKTFHCGQRCGPFLPFIPQLHQLTDLSLFSCSLSDEQAGLIMAGCKHLTSLALNSVRLESLGWLNSSESNEPMLTSFELSDCYGIQASDVISVLELKSLQELVLHSTCRLDALTQRALTPPTPFLPSLTEFDYAASQAGGEAEQQME